MSYFWSSILAVFLLPALMLSVHWSRRPCYSFWPLLLLSVVGFVLGSAIGLLLPTSTSVLLGFNIAYLLILIVFILWQFTHRREWFWHLLLCTFASALWARLPALQSLLDIQVINTEFILHLAAAFTGLAACMLLGWAMMLLLRHLPALGWVVIIFAALVSAIPMIGNSILAMIKLNILSTDSQNISIAAKTIHLHDQLPYYLLGLVFFCVLVGVLKLLYPAWQNVKQQTGLIDRRIALAEFRHRRSLLVCIAVLALLMLGVKLYWEEVVSQPPRLSHAEEIKLDLDDALHLPLKPLMDGNLHRFAWISSDGRVVRFFVINRLEDRMAPAVVFDACMLCGDKGYVQRGDQVVCVACGVYMFKPSIGKPGGCNPQPIEGWKVVGQNDESKEIIVPRAALEKGLQLFHGEVTIDVTDPVSGKQMTNVSAPYKYNYGQKTYFFADEESQKVFSDDPDKYIQKIEAQRRADLEAAKAAKEAAKAAEHPEGSQQNKELKQ